MAAITICSDFGAQKLSTWVCSNSCPLSQWCHSTICYPLLPPFPLVLNPPQHQSLFQWTLDSSLTKLYHYLKKKIIYFNWRIIALQYCADFCQTSTWINHRYTHVPSRPTHTPSHLSRFSQSSKFELPASDSMVISAFPCYSLHSSYPFLPALCPEICSLCLCLHCCITSWEILFLM